MREPAPGPAPPAGPTRLTRRLLLFAGLNGLVLPALLVGLLSVRWTDTALHPASWFVRGRQGEDSWRPLGLAWQFVNAARPQRARGIYDTLFFTPEGRRKPFQYPPSALLVIAALDRLTFGHWYAALEAITWAAIPITAFIAMRIYERALARSGLETEASRDERLARLVLALLVTVTFYPAIRAYRNGQIQTWLNAAFAALLWAWMEQRKSLAGMLVGAASLVKPQSLVLVAWGLLRKEWRFAGTAAATATGGLLASILAFGLPPHLEYLRVLAFIARRGESFYPNQSVNGLMNRLLFNGDNLARPEGFAPYHPWVYAATVTSSALILLLALWPPPPERLGGDVDLATAGLSFTIASPIAWEHHYGVLLPIFALLLPSLLAQRILGRWTMPVLAAAYVVASQSLAGLTNRLAATRLNVLQSSLLFAALAVLALLHALRRTPRPAGP